MKTNRAIALLVLTLLALNFQLSTAFAQCTTSVSGTVYAPNGTDPIYNALIYVPSGAPPTYGVQPFSPGVNCSQCGRDVSGQPLVWTVSGSDGTFTLTNMPVGVNIPLVIQIGRWRRVITIPSVTACANMALTASQTRLPRTQGEFSTLDNIPLMAIATANVDGLECLFRKIGIDDSQFSNPAAQGGTGRVRFYRGEGAPGAVISASTPSATQLWGSQAEIDQYDIVLFPNQGAEFLKTPAQQQVVMNYVNSGGRVLASHFSYVWLFNNAPFSSTALWNVGQPAPNDQTGHIATNFPRGLAMAQWLQTIGATTTFAQLSLSSLYQDFNGVVAPSLLWISLGAPPTGAFTAPMHYTFDAPVGSPPANQCGRVLYNDYIAEPAVNNAGLIFPSECAGGPMTPQQQLLEFAIFDLGSDLNLCVPTLSLAQTGPGLAMQFDGVASQVQVPANPTLTPSQFTFEAWVNPQKQDCNTIISRGDGNNAATDYIFQVGYNGSTCGAEMRISLWAGGAWNFSSNQVPLNAWSHVAVAYDGSALSFYINGALDAVVPQTNALYHSGLPLYIGRQGTLCNCNFFQGLLDEVRIWSIPLTQPQLRAGINQPLSGSEPGLLAYYQFDEGSGATATNSAATGSVFDGTLLNGPTWALSGVPFLPALRTAAATGITGNSAVLNGTVNPGNLPTSIYFQWGATTNYGNFTATNTLPATNLVFAISNLLAGLTPAAVYHCQLVAANSAGANAGADIVFHTAGLTSLVSSTSDTGVAHSVMPSPTPCPVTWSNLTLASPARPFCLPTVSSPLTRAW
jgi:hypothetical protein